MKGPASRRALFFIPAIVLLALAAAFGAMLNRDPGLVPSAVVGRPVPSFSLPPVLGTAQGLSTQDLKGQVSLVNVFASWCTACRTEHPLFMELKGKSIIQIHGLNYKDKPQDAAKWLAQLGDPYTRTGADLNGRVSIDWGVYGVPETFVISAVSVEALNQTILPLIGKQSRGEPIGSLPIRNER